VETSVLRQQQQLEKGCLPVALAALPSMVAAAIALTTTEIAKWLVQQMLPESKIPTLASKIITLDQTNLTLKKHSLTQRPQCPACGNPDLVSQQVNSAITLTSRKKLFTQDGGHRAFTPEQILQRYEHLISPITGVVSNLVRVSDPNNSLVHNYRATHAFGKLDLTALAQTDCSLTQAIESRQSIREYDNQPIILQQLGEFLYRCARVKEVYTLESDPINIGKRTKRPYPTGGGLYELEIYPVINQCQGLDSGLYHYQPLSHTLHLITERNPGVEALIFDAWKATAQQNVPQVLLIVTARFGRLFWKYYQIGYGLILKHIGVLYQTFYLVATAMKLAPSAISAGNSEQFCKVAGLNEYEESSVGEFSLGSLKEGGREQLSR